MPGSSKPGLCSPKPGETGTLNVRSHQDQVLIPYTTKTYSILYKDSSNLRYHPEKRTIHVNYAKWIERLDNEIKARSKMAAE